MPKQHKNPWKFRDRAGTALILMVCYLAFGQDRLRGHDDIDKQIDSVTKRIADEGESAPLLLQRASLHLLHEDWDTALRDYQRVLVINPDASPAQLGVAKAHLGKSDPRSGLTAIEAFLSDHPSHPEGTLIRARLFVIDGDLTRASGDFRAAAEKIGRRAAAVYFEWADALRKGGEKYWDDALGAVDEGIATLGGNVALQELGIGISIDRKTFDDAVGRIDALLKGPLKKSPRLLVLQAECYRKLSRGKEAMAGYAAARDQILAMPLRRRNTAAMQELLARIDTGIRTLSIGDPCSSGDHSADS